VGGIDRRLETLPRKRLVLDTPCNSGYAMQCPLVTSLTALDGPQDIPGGRVQFCCESTDGPPPGTLYSSSER
jgi:hypothetical protein